MAVQEQLMTAEEFAAMPNDGKLYELVKGVVVEVCRPKVAHGKLQIRIGHFFDAYVSAHDLGLATTETGYILSRNPDTVRGPDVAFISKERLPNPDFDEFVPMAPDLAVEIVSPNDTASDVATKVKEYLEAGTKLVWVFYPKLLAVYVHRPDGSAQVVERDGVLDGGDALPGFTLSLRDVFQSLGAEQ
jgi:Uma2 family endonuclease